MQTGSYIASKVLQLSGILRNANMEKVSEMFDSGRYVESIYTFKQLNKNELPDKKTDLK